MTQKYCQGSVNFMCCGRVATKTIKDSKGRSKNVCDRCYQGHVKRHGSERVREVML